MLQKIIFILSLSFFSSSVIADITPDNCVMYLDKPSMRYDIFVSEGDIVWDADPNIDEKVIEYENRLENEPENLEIILELISLYNKKKMYGEVEDLALEKLSLFENNFKENQNEKSTVQFAEIMMAANLKDQYYSTFLILSPYLENPETQKETYETAIKLSLSMRNTNLILFTTEAYITAYPDCANAYYLKFDSILNLNIFETIMYFLSSVIESITPENEEVLIDESNAEVFIRNYLQKIKENFDFDLIEKAVELEPDNYKYNLMAALYKTMFFYFSVVGSISYLDEEADIDLFEILLTEDPEMTSDILTYLERAESLKPQRDIQVYLLYTFFNLTLKSDFTVGRHYSQLAIDIRPDLPQGYDALIMSYMFLLINDNNDDNSELMETFRTEVFDIIKNKIENTGGEAKDFVYIAVLEYSLKHDDINEDEILNNMKKYLDRAFELEPDNSDGLLVLGNYYTLKGEYEDAIDIYSKGLRLSDEDNKVHFFNNRGIAKILSGDKQGGIIDLYEALKLSENNEKTIEALESL